VPGAYPQTPRSALLAWRDGRLVEVTADVAPALASVGLVTAALWSDVDDDGWIDLLVACEWGPVRCFRNVDGRRFEEKTDAWGFASGGTGWWRALAAGDFNGDGKLDYVAGNTGLNTRYRADAQAPALLFAGMGGGPVPQLVEAEAENGVYYPLRDRETLARVLPAALRPFPTAEAYAKATLDEVFPPALRDGATRFAASELRNGIFLSHPDGTWKFAALPRLAQIAPLQSLQVGDWDGDGRLDVLATGNAFSPTPETGRFDGGVGWLLQGDGRGGFVPMAPRESGFIVPGDGRALGVLDLDRDGRPDFLALRNNDRALYFQNQGRAGRGSFRVAFRGPAGNPTAIGARLTLTLRDGGTQRIESSGAPMFFGYAEANPPVRLQVRWPDGKISEQTFTGFPAKQVVLSP
jgi:hypothetical protein